MPTHRTCMICGQPLAQPRRASTVIGYLLLGIVGLWCLTLLSVAVMNGPGGRGAEGAAVIFFALVLFSIIGLPAFLVLLLMFFLLRRAETNRIAHCPCGQRYRVYPPPPRKVGPSDPWTRGRTCRLPEDPMPQGLQLSAAAVTSLIVAIPLLIGWLACLCHCANAPFKDVGAHVSWTLVVLFLGPLGAFLYVLGGRVRQDRAKALEKWVV